jgi:NAD(P)-dependent dehydrogenase (short-subunit alcohol dehydrogenase family)
MITQSNLDTLVTVFGGSGFLGRHVVRALCKRGYRVRVAVRRPDLAGHLQPLGRVGQIHAVAANLRYPASVEAAARDADIVINLVGILFEAGRQRFDSVHAFGAEAVALAAAAFGARLIHISAIGADADAPSHYARPKAMGEKPALAAMPSATIEPAALPRFRALALFRRRPPERIDRLVMPVSENLAQTQTSRDRTAARKIIARALEPAKLRTVPALEPAPVPRAFESSTANSEVRWGWGRAQLSRRLSMEGTKP